MSAFANFSVFVTKGKGEDPKWPDPILAEICTMVTVFDDSNICEGWGARYVDLSSPKCSDPILAEICTIVMVFDDRNIDGRKECSGGRFGVSKVYDCNGF